jgi:hypothetical protein
MSGPKYDTTEWNAFLGDPEHASVRDTAVKFPPWLLFKLTETDQIVCVTSYFEDGTLKAYIDPEFNDPNDFRTGFEVFGIKPGSLEPWDVVN